MEMFRLHAYTVVPSRTSGESLEPRGGAIRINSDLRTALEKNAIAANFDQQPGVVFVVDTTTRTSPVRDAVIQFAFGTPVASQLAALTLAERLGASMDRRSSPALFVPSAYKHASRRQVLLWVFPSEDAFQLRTTSSGPSIQILQDAFSQKSHLRKAARFHGANVRGDFLEGRVLDLQAKNSAREAAGFWIERFLHCTLSMGEDAGSRLIARIIRKVYEATEDVDDREQLYAASLSIRRSPHRRISLTTFADRYLEGSLKNSFLQAAPNEETRAALFDFNREVFDEVLRFRVFQLESGVVVSSPLTQIGQAVRLSGSANKTLTCKGTVVADRMKSRA